MIVRAATSIFALSAVGLASAPLGAQQSISYETGEYEYAQPLPELDDDVVTETVAKPAGETVAPAARVIPARQPTPQFVSKPTIQAIDPSADEYYTYEAPIEADAQSPAARTIAARAPAATMQAAQPTYVYVQSPPQVVYVYPAQHGVPVSGGASRVIYTGARPSVGSTAQQSPNSANSVYLPAGSQLVQFDRATWLEECRARLDTYENESERGEILGALIGGAAGGLLGNRIAGSGSRTAGTLIGAGAGAVGGALLGDALESRKRAGSDSAAQCQAYLDDYMRQATASAGSVAYSQPGQYMLLPVTVEVPQRAVYRDGTPAN